MVGCKGIHRPVLWFYGLLMVAFPFIMGICSPYIASALLMSSIVIGQFLI